MSKERFTTPFGECMYPFLQQPSIDKSDNNFPDVFKITLVCTKEHDELLKQIIALYKDSGGTETLGEKGHPIKFHKTIEGKQVDGTFDIVFKSKAEFYDHIFTCDSDGREIVRLKNFVANGSVVRVNWSYAYYNKKGNKGVSLFLNGVQIRDLIEWQGLGADEMGFNQVEGYKAGDDVPVEFKSEPSDEDLNQQDGSPVEDDLPF